MTSRIFISADIEGTCGIAHWDETEKGHIGYDQFARQMSLEVAAACEGAPSPASSSMFLPSVWSRKQLMLDGTPSCSPRAFQSESGTSG